MATHSSNPTLWASGTRESLELAACQPIPRSSETVSREEGKRTTAENTHILLGPLPVYTYATHTPLRTLKHTHPTGDVNRSFLTV